MSEQLNLSSIYDEVIIKIKNLILEINNKKIEVEEIEEAVRFQEKYFKSHIERV